MLGKNVGINLLELLTAIALLAILALISIPSLIELYQEKHLLTTAQNLYYAMRFAKSEAIKNNSAVYVVFQTGDNWCFGINVNSTCNCSIANNCTAGRYTAAKTQDLSLTLSGVTGNQIQFEGGNGSLGNASTMTFTIYGQTKEVSVKANQIGNVKICSNTLSGYPTCT